LSAPHETHALPIPEAELQELHRNDLGAARVIVGLVGSIFLVGFFLYGAIAWIVASG
jgi:hypothetical protein